MNVETLQRALAEILPKERTRFQEPSQETVTCLGDCVPRLTSSPESHQEAKDVIKFAEAESLAVVPVGSGSKLALGNRLNKGDLFLSTQSLAPTLEVFPDDLVLHVSSGTPFHVAQEEAKTHGLRIPLDPPDPHRATLGGLAATDSFGSLRTGYGRLRDYVVGMRVLTSRGELAQSGGRVVKNVTGYDLIKLHLGGLGTLGLILDMDLRLLPIPDEDQTLVREYEDLSDAWEDAWALQSHREVCPESLEIFSTETQHDEFPNQLKFSSPYALALRVQGSKSAVSSRLLTASRLLRKAKDEPRELGSELGASFFEALGQRRSVADPAPHLLTTRSVLRPSQMGHWLSGALEYPWPKGVNFEWLLSPSLGLVDVRVQDGRQWLRADPHLDLLHTLARRSEGYVRTQAAPLSLRDQVDVLGPIQNLSLHESVKVALDPGGIFNPGRQLGGL